MTMHPKFPRKAQNLFHLFSVGRGAIRIVGPLHCPGISYRR
jgi:hypothetical protein